MKSDLDHLMQAADIDALLIVGPAQHNPAMFYMTGGGHMTHADLIKPHGAEPILFHSPMERDEAARTGLKTKNIMDYKPEQLAKAAKGDRLLANAMRYQLMFEEMGITSGRVSIYGREELNGTFGMLMALQKLLPEVEFIGEQPGQSVLLRAMATKDASEIERIRQMGKITTEVVGLVAEYLGSHYAPDGVLIQPDGSPLTIGLVKNKINLWLAERGAENPHGTIFAQGYDAGVPHSTGDDSAPLVLGKPIVFDIFPTEAGGGYHYDFTRTWCLGYADEQTEAIYDDVRTTYETVMNELTLDSPNSIYQERTCELFEAQGHPTIRQDSSIQEGYVHSLGHGLGLHVHEAPWFRGKKQASEKDTLAAGVVVTIEPGLYYPSREIGCRLEDTVVVNADGSMEVLADFPLDLIIPVQTS